MDQKLTYQRRSRACCILFSVAVLVISVLSNCPWEYVTVSSASFGEAPSNMTLQLSGSRETMRRAGWPWTYYVAVSNAGDEQESSEIRYFSRIGFLGDVSLGVALIVLVWKLTAFRAKRIFLSTDPPRTRRKFDVAIAIVILLLPPLFLGGALLARRSHVQFCLGMDESSRCVMTAEVPWLIASRFPRVIRPFFHRVRGVLLLRPTSHELQEACRFSTLRLLAIDGLNDDNGCTFDLSGLPQLSELNLRFCDLNIAQSTAISKHEFLSSLSLYGSRLNEANFRPIASMKRLRRVDLQRTRLRNSSIGRPRWANTVEELYVSRPSAQADELRLTDWPKLQVLSAQSGLLQPNPLPFTVHLDGLPKLEFLYLDRLQKHALFLHRLPELKTIEEPSPDFLFDLVQECETFGLTWFERLEVIDVPKIKSLLCSVHDLEHLRIRGTSRLESIELGSHKSVNRGLQVIPPRFPHLVTEWIKEISKLESLTTLDLSTMPLGGVDLSPLARLNQLQEIRLELTGIADRQLLCFCEHPSLKRLVLGKCIVSEQVFQSLETGLPMLESLYGDLSQVNELQLTQRSALRHLITPEFHPTGKFEMVGLPRFSGRVRVGGHPSSLRFVQMPRLEELVVTSPWPSHSEIEGLRALRCFAGGGPLLRNEIVDVLLGCPKMDVLTLAYAQLSIEKLIELRTFKNLTGLHVPGCGVNDQVTEQWRQMERLRSVCLDDNPIGADTLDWLRSLPSLRRLSLSRVKLDDAAMARLREIDQVSELCLDGCNLSDHCLDKMLLTGHLESIDLSHVDMHDVIWKQLRDARGLKHLIIRGNSIDHQRLSELLNHHHQLAVDVDPEMEATLIENHEIASERFVRRHIHVPFSFVGSQIEDFLTSVRDPSYELRIPSDDVVMKQYRRAHMMNTTTPSL